MFPLLGGAAAALVVGVLAVPALLRGWADPSPSASAVAAVAAVAVGYLLAGFVFTLCGAAMVCAVDDVLRGEPVRVGVNCRRALRHWRRLLAWSLLNTTVLVLVRQLERVPVIGWFMDGLFSTGWAVATYLALPAMMIDGLGIAEGTRRSARMLRETFSRQVYGSVWIAVPLVLSVIVGFVAFMLGAESNSAGLAAAGGVLAALLLACALLAGATVSGIFRTVLYRDVSVAA
ncbi:DUF6159 family protein [Kitasatospora sp. NPDC088783]|uniref:DUF6159 family protein n=1 Tax=Kitasatospora sp. NPDC088783 TaxID=3364077 RepID=UPI00381F3B83